METFFGSNWKTTLAGMVTSITIIILTMVSGGAALTPAAIIQAIAPAIIGALAKDHDTTGTGSTASK